MPLPTKASSPDVDDLVAVDGQGFGDVVLGRHGLDRAAAKREGGRFLLGAGASLRLVRLRFAVFASAARKRRQDEERGRSCRADFDELPTGQRVRWLVRIHGVLLPSSCGGSCRPRSSRFLMQVYRRIRPVRKSYLRLYEANGSYTRNNPGLVLRFERRSRTLASLGESSPARMTEGGSDDVSGIPVQHAPCGDVRRSRGRVLLAAPFAVQPSGVVAHDPVRLLVRGQRNLFHERSVHGARPSRSSVRDVLPSCGSPVHSLLPLHHPHDQRLLLR